jgi:exonuclease VII small subunit
MSANLRQKYLPAALIESEEFKALNPLQASRFEARFPYLEEIIENIERWLKHDSKDTTLRSFLDDLELDLAVIQNLPGVDKSEPSAWLVHSSWTFNCSAFELRAQLEPKIIESLECASLPLEATTGQIEEWLRGQTICARMVLQNFRSAATFASAIAHHVAIDILFGSLLVGTYKARLNPAVHN